MYSYLIRPGKFQTTFDTNFDSTLDLTSTFSNHLTYFAGQSTVVWLFDCFYVRPSDFWQSIYGQTACHCVCKSWHSNRPTLQAIYEVIHLGYGKKRSSHMGIKPRSLLLWAVYSTLRPERFVEINPYTPNLVNNLTLSMTDTVPLVFRCHLYSQWIRTCCRPITTVALGAVAPPQPYLNPPRLPTPAPWSTGATTTQTASTTRLQKKPGTTAPGSTKVFKYSKRQIWAGKSLRPQANNT